ncbi:MAG: ankyrin repeat domain-containing protein [Gemmatimonadota bacterium]|nr:ankyrin repeat domain-containing protein [Gemmatimonadota bacterium]
MSEETRGSASASLSLPDAANLDWLRKQAKRRLAELRQARPEAKLADAQFDLARLYGFSSWRALKAHIDSLTLDGQLFDAARKGDVDRLSALLDKHPNNLHAREKPYEWTLLHAAAQNGHLAAVDVLLRRGLDVNTREKGDNTYAMHWAAAAGHLDVVRRLADAGGDVVGHGDDHALGVIGWATCWDGCDDATHRAVADVLVSRGARHHIFSAIAMNLADEVRRIVAAEPAALTGTLSRNENYQLPLHFAARMNRPEMVALLLKLGADPAAGDGSGVPAVVYAAEPKVDRSVIEALTSGKAKDVFSALALGDEGTAARLLRESRDSIDPGGASAGALHLLAKRGDARAVRWLLDRGADSNALCSHWDAMVTPLHLAASRGNAEVVRVLLQAGADPRIRDSMHDGDATGWAEHFQQPPIVDILEARAARS